MEHPLDEILQFIVQGLVGPPYVLLLMFLLQQRPSVMGRILVAERYPERLRRIMRIAIVGE